jgi:hypothetical protein
VSSGRGCAPPGAGARARPTVWQCAGARHPLHPASPVLFATARAVLASWPHPRSAFRRTAAFALRSWPRSMTNAQDGIASRLPRSFRDDSGNAAICEKSHRAGSEGRRRGCVRECADGSSLSGQHPRISACWPVRPWHNLSQHTVAFLRRKCIECALLGAQKSLLPMPLKKSTDRAACLLLNDVIRVEKRDAETAPVAARPSICLNPVNRHRSFLGKRLDHLLWSGFKPLMLVEFWRQ